MISNLSKTVKPLTFMENKVTNIFL